MIFLVINERNLNTIFIILAIVILYRQLFIINNVIAFSFSFTYNCHWLGRRIRINFLKPQHYLFVEAVFSELYSHRNQNVANRSKFYLIHNIIIILQKRATKSEEYNIKINNSVRIVFDELKILCLEISSRRLSVMRNKYKS